MTYWHGDLVSWQGNLVSWKANMDSWQVPSKEPNTLLELPKIYSVSLEHIVKAVCATGNPVLIDIMGQAPDGYKTFEASASEGLYFDVEGTKFNFGFSGHPSRWYLQPSCKLKLVALVPSSKMFSEWVRITYFKYGEECSNRVAKMKVTCISLNLLEEKSQEIKKKQKKKKNKPFCPSKQKICKEDLFKSGMRSSSGACSSFQKNIQSPWQGPIMLVNCGCKNEYPPQLENHEEEILYDADVKEMAKMILDINSPLRFFSTYRLIIHCTHPDRVRLFGPEGSSINRNYKLVLGPNKPCHTIKRLRNRENRTFYVEALSFPDADFSGIVSFTVSLLYNYRKNESEHPIHHTRMAFRVAPWIMISNTQPPMEIYVTSNLRKWPLRPWRSWKDSEDPMHIRWLTGSAQPTPGRSRLIPESDFISTLCDFAQEADCELNFCPEDRSRLETWIGKEVAIGYTYGPKQRFPVFLDVPWNRNLDFVFKNSLPSSFGYVIREREDDDNMDALGFLEVSPPVIAHGIIYPLGRILIGNGSLPRENISEVNQKLRRFLYAQNMQEPLELFSEWLLEGNVKEFLTFVPANDGKGFRLLLASPSACYELFKMEQSRGHGKASVLDRVDKNLLSYSERKKMSINEILADNSLRRQNDYAQTCISWNRRVLKAELGLSEKDIIDIPQLFRLGWIKDPSTKKEVLRAGHLFPNMLNMIVLGSHLGIPKPFGPFINGVCCVEKTVRNLLEPLGLNCLFIAEFYGHQDWGDAYYWINIRRKPLTYKWWNMIA